jgi:predicted ester cyclase
VHGLARPDLLSAGPLPDSLSRLDTYNRGDWEWLAAHVSPEYINHTRGQTLDWRGSPKAPQWFRSGFPDLTVTVEDILADNDRLAVRFVARRPHQGSLFGERPTFRQVVLDGITIYRFENNVIVEDWEMMDEQQLRTQLDL